MGCASSKTAAGAHDCSKGEELAPSEAHDSCVSTPRLPSGTTCHHSARWDAIDSASFCGEPERVAQLRSLGVLRTEPEPRFDNITKLMAAIFKTPVALVSLIEESTLWMKSIAGPFGACVARGGSMCDMVLVPPAPEVMVVEDVKADARYAANPFVAGPPYARYYAGAPLVGSGGVRYGTLCIIDVRPRRFKAELLQTLINFAELVVREMEGGKALRRRMLAPDASAISRGLAEYTEGVALVDVGDASWQVLYVNDHWAERVGLPVDECTRRGLWAMLRAEAPEAAAEVQAAVAGGRAVQLEVRSVTRQGGEPLRLTLRPSSDALAADIPVGMPGFVQMGGSGSDAARFSIDSERSARTNGTDASMQASAAALWMVQLQPMSVGGGPSPLARQPPDRLATATPVRAAAVAASQVALCLQPYGLARPERFADLRLGPLLGSGSFGRVHRGVYRGKRVAVKIVELPEGCSCEAQQRALNEGLLSNQFSHANVVSTLDYAAWEQEGHNAVWIVQQYCNRGTLLDAIDRGWLREERTLAGRPNLDFVLRTAADIASAMAYIHSRNTLHGDLSSGNVLLASSTSDPRGFTALVADFGLARLLEGATLHTEHHGTVSHMPPELLSEGLLTRAADVYSFGVCLWEMYTMRRAWCGCRAAQVIMAVTSGRGALPLPDDAPQPLKDLVAQCMEPAHEMRPSFEHVVASLGELQATVASA